MSNEKKSSAIIIGGTSGIGKAVAQVLLENDYIVAIVGLERDNLDYLVDKYPNQLNIEYLDCSIKRSSDKFLEVVDTLGGLDLFVFSAGVGHLNKDIGYPAENSANQVNVLSFTEMSDWAYRYFNKQGKGHLVCITSIAGFIGYSNAPAYNAAKAYQITYTEGLRQKARKARKAKKLIYVTDIRPGFVDTEMSKELRTFWLATPTKAAKQIYTAINKKSSIAYVTKRWQIIALLLRILPDWIRGRV